MQTTQLEKQQGDTFQAVINLMNKTFGESIFNKMAEELRDEKN